MRSGGALGQLADVYPLFRVRIAPELVEIELDGAVAAAHGGEDGGKAFEALVQVHVHALVDAEGADAAHRVADELQHLVGREHFGLEDDVDIIMGTFSKSLASLGGYMASTKRVVDYVKHNSRPYIFSASITPCSVATARESLKILRENPSIVKSLQEVATYMRNGLKKLNVNIIDSQTPIIPIYVYDDEKAFMACKLLLERGVYVNPVVSPATPVGQALLRTSYTATHTHEQMDKAMKAIREVLDILGL